MQKEIPEHDMTNVHDISMLKMTYQTSILFATFSYCRERDGDWLRPQRYGNVSGQLTVLSSSFTTLSGAGGLSWMSSESLSSSLKQTQSRV